MLFSVRSLVVRKIVWILAQVLWLAICLAALIDAYKSYRDISDWQVEEGLGIEMMVLSFPGSFAVVAGFILTGMLLRLFGLALPASSKPEMIATWAFFVAAGYIQWFLLVPKFPRWWKNSQQKRHPGS
jgi:EamA domain-containing membrane protein RarD